MGFDIGSLNLTAEPTEIAPEDYVKPAGGEFEPIPAGTYPAIAIKGKFNDRTTGKSSEIRFGGMTSKKNGKTYMSAEFALKITDGKYAGRLLFAKVNTMPESLIFNEVEKGRENANSYLDALMAFGYTGSLKSNEDYQTALEAIVGEERPIKANTNWEWYCNPNSTEYRGDGKTIRGQKNASLLADGTPNPRLTYLTEYGDEVVLLARNVVKGLYAVKK